jgi:ribonuclease HII
MARDLSKLTVGEIRARFVDSGRTVSPQLLKKLARDPRRGVEQLRTVLERRYRKQRDEKLRLDAMLNFERVLWKSGIQRIAGVDEAGMGPLAGPVVAAAVAFPPGTEPDAELAGVDDSKRLDAETRERLAGAIRQVAAAAVAVVEPREIDQVNIYQAGLLAMHRAVKALPEPPQHVLVDARPIPDLDCPQNQFDKGDGLNFSIAAASIIAKTHRDALMVELDRQYPGYGFASHKGYATPEHQEAIRRLGPCPIHRTSYTYIDELCGNYSERFYQLKSALDAADGSAALVALEAEVGAAELPEIEQRKLRQLINRRL